MNENRIDETVLGALSGGLVLCATDLAKRTRLPRAEVLSAIARLAAENKVAHALATDDGFVVEAWSLARPRPKRPDRVTLEQEQELVAAE